MVIEGDHTGEPGEEEEEVKNETDKNVTSTNASVKPTNQMFWFYILKF